MDFLKQFIVVLFNILTFAILARALLSWFAIRPENPLMVFLREVTEPVLAPLRRVVPSFGMVDLTPLIALILLQVLANLLLGSLTGL